MSLPISTYSQQQNTVESIEKAIIKGAVALGWQVDVKKKGVIMATLNIRKHQLVVLITHDDKSFSVQYKDSKNLMYDGTHIHRQYPNWVNNLIRTINSSNITM